MFHVSLLKQYEAGGDSVIPPEPIVIDGDTEFEVERIFGHRQRHGCQREYLVRWAGYDSSADMWLPESELHHA